MARRLLITGISNFPHSKNIGWFHAALASLARQDGDTYSHMRTHTHMHTYTHSQIQLHSLTCHYTRSLHTHIFTLTHAHTHSHTLTCTHTCNRMHSHPTPHPSTCIRLPSPSLPFYPYHNTLPSLPLSVQVTTQQHVHATAALLLLPLLNYHCR